MMFGPERGGRWIVWGFGSPIPDSFFQMESGDERAVALAAETDPEWMESEDAWVIILSADEVSLDEWVRAHGSARGYMRYEAVPLDASAEIEAGEHRQIQQQRPY